MKQYIHSKKRDHNYPKFRIDFLFLPHFVNKENKFVDDSMIHFHYLYDDVVLTMNLNFLLEAANVVCCLTDCQWEISNPELNFCSVMETRLYEDLSVKAFGFDCCAAVSFQNLTKIDPKLVDHVDLLRSTNHYSDVNVILSLAGV